MKSRLPIYYSRIIKQKSKRLLKVTGFSKNYLSAREIIGVSDVPYGRTKCRNNICNEGNSKMYYYPALENFIQNPDRLIQEKLKYPLCFKEFKPVYNFG